MTSAVKRGKRIILRDNEGNLLFGWKNMAVTLWNMIFTLLKANLCFLILSIPVVTIPCNLYALTVICSDGIRNGDCRIIPAFKESYRVHFLESWKILALPAGLFSIGIVSAKFYFGSLPQNGMYTVPGIISTFVAVIAYMMVPYVLTLAVSTKLKTSDILKDSFFLIFLNPGFSICSGCLTMAMLILAAMAFLHMIPLIITCWISMIVYVGTYIAMSVIQKFILTEKY